MLISDHPHRRLAAAVVFVVAAFVSGAALAGPASQPAGPVLKTKFGEVMILPADNPWNQDVSKLAVHPLSAAYVRSIGEGKSLHPDFGTVYNGAPNGIPFVVVGPDQPKIPVQFEYADESDKGPYPIPPDAPIEGGPASKGDRHVLVLDPVHKLLYETWSSYKTDKGWKAGSGAIFDLATNKLRPEGWTSSDAAGLPVFPGLVRYDEAVERGEIRHAIRFTVTKTQRGYIHPATHFASASKDANLPPMGLRMRLKATFDSAKAPKSCLAIIRCLQTYGLILADNGGDWYISGAPDAKWNDDELNWLKSIKGRDFEAVNTGPIIKG